LYIQALLLRHRACRRRVLVSFRGLCCGTVCVAAGGRMITLLVLVDRLKIVIRSGDVPCRCQVVVFACRVNRCVSHEESFWGGCGGTSCWSQGQLLLPWHRPRVWVPRAPRYSGKRQGHKARPRIGSSRARQALSRGSIARSEPGWQALAEAAA
jgi:hypothetical protein